MFRNQFLIMSLFLFYFAIVSCDEGTQLIESSDEVPVVETPMTETPDEVPVVENPIDEVPDETPIVENPPDEAPEEVPEVEDNFCQVGDILKPGESCLDGTGDTFRVLENGLGQYLFITAGGGIHLRGNINGKNRNFTADKQDDGTWRINSVTPKE